MKQINGEKELQFIWKGTTDSMKKNYRFHGLNRSLKGKWDLAADAADYYGFVKSATKLQNPLES